MIQPHTSHPDKKPQPGRVLFFGRHDCDATQAALARLRSLGFEVSFVTSKGRGESLPAQVGAWAGDYIFCFRSLFVLPRRVLDKAGTAAINFHPAPTEYPGSGCLNFALYDGARDYGVTAHLMNEKVDNGRILECRRFPILDSDTVDSLLEKTHRKLLELFLDVAAGVAAQGRIYIDACLEKSEGEHWRGEALKMSALEKLKTIAPDVDAAELDRVVRATYTEMYPPRVILHGYEFVLKSPKKITS
ncbi:MAG: formyltransferase family protein [Burkholderiaceae bacterium]|nr:formyltransferase family protein [Burkholderiaceae bacterium]